MSSAIADLQPALPRLEVRRLGMTFDSVQVLRDVNVAIAPGEIHAVCGENGAGKSTLMKILSGIYKPTTGEVFFEGKPAHFNSVTDAEAARIMMIHQEFTLASSLTVQQNFFLGRELRAGPFLRDREMDARTREALALVGCTVAPNRRISDLKCLGMSARRNRQNARPQGFGAHSR